MTSNWLQHAGEMGKLVAAKDWSKTPLGPIETWPQSLRTTVSLCLSSNFPIAIAWGPERTQIYNDGYWPICAAKHPHSMGQDFKECWFSAWPQIGEAFESAAAGKTAFLTNQRMFLDRNGYLEETFFTFSFSPIHNESGDIGGLFHPVTELTQQSLAERRLQILRDVANETANIQNIDEALSKLAQTVVGQAFDIPFALFFNVDNDSQQAILVESIGLKRNSDYTPEHVDLTLSTSAAWPLAEVAKTDKCVLVEDLLERFEPFECEPYPEPPHSAFVLPLSFKGQNHVDVLMVVGISSRRPLDDAYRNFYEMLGAAVTTALIRTHSFEQELRRAEMLAELDRSKTVFFSNVSHEFRTPLTLMLGPLEELQSRFATTSAEYEQLTLVHRNGLRLLKLVNALLDFSRIEAGRMVANYEATDLASYTAELASIFRSATEKAGLKLIVSCPALPELVYVDRQMWEKIVINLLSNAFKHTFEGEIEVALRWCGKQVELAVRDTGVGIAEDQLEHVFDRFHRVQNVRSRTYEGTGIGLALVLELARLHGGEISVKSKPGVGSIFTVTVPTGKGHLKTELLNASPSPNSRKIGVDYLVDEVMQLGLGVENKYYQGKHSEILETNESSKGTHILLADDNADMRGYVARLLQEQGYDVTAVCDGEAALAALSECRPDLVLTDIMMPRLDGIGLLETLRERQETNTIPIILLSARAGEETRLEGLKQGADDYLIKPFSAQELQARVAACLNNFRLRSEAEAKLRAQENEREFRALAETMPQIVWATRPDGWNVYFNHQWVEYTGLTFEESYGHGWNKPFHPDDQQRAWDDWQRATLNNESYSLECRLRRADGVYRWWLIRGVPLIDENGTIKKWYGTCTDIEDIKQTEATLRESESRFRTLFEQAAVGVAEIETATGRFIRINQCFCNIVDYTREEMITRDFQSITHPDDLQADLESMDRLVRGEIREFTMDKRYFRKDHSIVWVSLTVSPMWSLGEQPGHHIAIVEDISARKLAEEELQLAALVYRNSSEAMLVADANNRIVAVNPAFTKLTGYTAEEAIGQTPKLLNSGRQTPDFYQAMWHAIDTTGHWQGEIWNRRKNGEVYVEWLIINTIKDEVGSIHRRVALFSDITQKKENEELIWTQANFDSLTGLPNRRMFQDRLELEIRKAHRANLSLTLMYLDLDHFKEVNDTLGHSMGDQLLKEAAQRLTHCVRESDTVARLGGDEFIVILSDLDKLDSTERIAQDILDKLTEPYQLDDEVAYVSVSIGITQFPEDATEIDTLLKNADQAMYAAKNTGRSRFSYFTQAMQDAALARMRLTNNLRSALANNELMLFYQPIVNLTTGSIQKAEALIRWQHPTSGLISPAAFIPIAEETGMIVDIGDWVFHQSVHQVSRWRAMHHEEFQISINKSPVQFHRDSNLQRHAAWLEHLRQLALPGQSIVVEITEGLLLDASDTVSEQLLSYRDSEIQVSLDDFGTGYSSLSYLTKFDIDYLKIDQSFVRNLTADSDNMALCEAIIMMAHKLGIKVIAEGVETAEQRDLLIDANCDFGQGYLFSRPVPAQEFEELLLQQQHKTAS